MNNLSFAVEDYIEQDLFLSTDSHEKEETKNNNLCVWKEAARHSLLPVICLRLCDLWILGH